MGNRCSDGHFILHNLIKDYCNENGKWLYSCFVDFSKAFDCIPRDILFERLKTKGITGKVFDLIKKIHMNEKCKIKVGGMLTDTFETRGEGRLYPMGLPNKGRKARVCNDSPEDTEGF